MQEKRSIVIYSRKSRFTGKGESIENQIEMCRQYIRIQFGAEAAEEAQVYEDGPIIIGLNQAKPCDTRGTLV